MERSKMGMSVMPIYRTHVSKPKSKLYGLRSQATCWLNY